MRRPIGIDLFAGAGGLSLGFEQAGFDVVAAVEIDPVHACVHKFNFPNCAVLPRSVTDLSGDDIRKAANIGRRRVDVVFGGAPCQGFSLIGHRVLDDPRNALVRDFVRIVKELDAKYFVFENVKGLTLGRHRKFLDELIEAFSQIDYDVRLPWRVLNATSYGVPQERERLILIGGKKGQPLPDYPVATTSAAGAHGIDLPRGPSCEDALGDLPNAEKFAKLIDGDEVATDAWGTPSEYARKMRGIANDDTDYSYPRRWDRRVLTSSMRTTHTEISRRRFTDTAPGEVEPISRFFKLPRHGVANTLRAGTDAARGAFTSPRPIHYKHPRCITVREMARLHGFPDWFRLHSTKWHGARQIGNAVAPPLAKAIASKIVDALGVDPSRPDVAIDLGDPALLKMGLKEASAHWGIESPIGRRDRKSGAKKRKQHETEAARLIALEMSHD
jgi:DNA (cytosine-5)-methyltransferase 1